MDGLDKTAQKKRPRKKIHEKWGGYTHIPMYIYSAVRSGSIPIGPGIDDLHRHIWVWGYAAYCPFIYIYIYWSIFRGFFVQSLIQGVFQGLFYRRSAKNIQIYKISEQYLSAVIFPFSCFGKQTQRNCNTNSTTKHSIFVSYQILRNRSFARFCFQMETWEFNE